jgi:hypothetical protein
MEVGSQLHTPAALVRGKSPWYLLHRRQGGPQSRSKRYGEEKNKSCLAGDRTRAVETVARPYVDWAIPTPQNTNIPITIHGHLPVSLEMCIGAWVSPRACLDIVE